MRLSVLKFKITKLLKLHKGRSFEVCFLALLLPTAGTQLVVKRKIPGPGLKKGRSRSLLLGKGRFKESTSCHGRADPVVSCYRKEYPGGYCYRQNDPGVYSTVMEGKVQDAIVTEGIPRSLCCG
jgi:hypothetical protein